MTGNGQDVSLRHFELRHIVVGYETRTVKEDKFIASFYIILVYASWFISTITHIVSLGVYKMWSEEV
jgi:hypothetical protein